MLPASSRSQALARYGIPSSAFVSVYEASKILGISKGAVRRRCRAKKIPAVLDDRSIRIPTLGLLKYIKNLPDYSPKGAARAQK